MTLVAIRTVSRSMSPRAARASQATMNPLNKGAVVTAEVTIADSTVAASLVAEYHAQAPSRSFPCRSLGARILLPLIDAAPGP
ncbi:hypothetical protein VT85_12360 [Planctomyces sp. SH-PL62]|nr:hypothetical protein VT85_12360 [Planctomyces sp. SH-PL62]